MTADTVMTDIQHYDKKPVPHQTLPNGVRYALSTKSPSKAANEEPPPAYSYVEVNKKKVS